MFRGTKVVDEVDFGGSILHRGLVVAHPEHRRDHDNDSSCASSPVRHRSSRKDRIGGGMATNLQEGDLYYREARHEADDATHTYQTALEDVNDGRRVWNDAWHAEKLRKSGFPALSAKDGQGAVTMTRRQAWVRFLALDACKDLCIDALVRGGEEGNTARGFLEEGCRVLKDGLGVRKLLLEQGQNVNIFWDDVEQQQAQRLVMVGKGAPKHDVDRKEKVVRNKDTIKSFREPDVSMAQEHLASYDWRVPCVDVKVLRIVGAPFLESFEHDSSTDTSPANFVVQTLAHDRKSSSMVGSTGGVLSGETLYVSNQSNKSAHSSVKIDVFSMDRKLLACGSVMISELQRLAARCDALGQEPPPSLLKQLIKPSGWKRKDSGGSMVWVKLTGNNGSPSGHILLSAKAIPGDLTVAGVMGPTSQGHSGGGTSGNAPILTETDIDGTYKQDIGTAWKKNPLVQLDSADDGHTSSLENSLSEEKGLIAATLHDDAPKGKDSSAGYLQINVRHVYSALLDCALRASECDRPASPLELKPEWSWLLRTFAGRHGIREEYATLSYLQWILEKHIVRPNSMCFEVVTAKYGAIKHVDNGQHALESHEIAMFTNVRQDIKTLLNKAFENYYSLKQQYDDDVGEEYLSIRGPQAATVLRSAFKLLKLVLAGDEHSAIQWASVRFKKAANKRFYSILAAVETQLGEDEREPKRYKKLCDLCQAIMEEVRADEAIQNSEAFPKDVSLPFITSLEYCKGLAAHLKSVITRNPPQKPTASAIMLVQAVGGLQDFVERHGYVDAGIQLSAYDVFRDFIIRWIASSSASLKRGIQIIDDSGPREISQWKDLYDNGGNMVVPFAEVLMRELQKEMEVYRPLLCFWPCFAVEVEAACVDVLRSAVSVASSHCGLVQTTEHQNSSKRRTAWKWAAIRETAKDGSSVTEAIRSGTSVPQALLMNTLRRLLAVIPQMESSIYSWCQETPLTKSQANGPSPLRRESLGAFSPVHHKDRIAQEAPMLGVQWAQLVKELRTEYYASITLTAESISRALSSSSRTSIHSVLSRAGLEASDSAIVRRIEKALDQTAPTIQILSSVLDSRVFVALARGLWDLTAKQILQFSEELREDEGHRGGHAWRGRQNAAAALSCVQNFYKHKISNCMGSDLQPKDLAPPQHSQRASALLASNTTELDKSFDVY